MTLEELPTPTIPVPAGWTWTVGTDDMCEGIELRVADYTFAICTDTDGIKWWLVYNFPDGKTSYEARGQSPSVAAAVCDVLLAYAKDVA